jgi:hypothetical protein
MPDQSFLFFFTLLDLVILAAVVGCHKEAIYSMAIIVFNSSVDIRESRVILAGAALCVRTASLGQVMRYASLGTACMMDTAWNARFPTSAMKSRRGVLCFY